MAIFSRNNPYLEPTDWTGRAMSEEEYHKLEQISLERKYEYINGVAYMMSGGSIEHDQIIHNTHVALTRQLRPGPCRVFGVDVQILLGQKKNGKPHFIYPDTTVSRNTADQRQGHILVENPCVVVEAVSPGTAPKPETGALISKRINIVQPSRRLYWLTSIFTLYRDLATQ